MSEVSKPKMNANIGETMTDHAPWVWIMEVVFHEIASGGYPFPYRLGEIDGEEVFYLRTAHVIHHLRTKPGLKTIWDGMTVKSDRVLKSQLKAAGVILVDRVDPTIGGERIGHMVALSMNKLAEFGLHPEEKER